MVDGKRSLQRSYFECQPLQIRHARTSGAAFPARKTGKSVSVRRQKRGKGRKLWYWSARRPRMNGDPPARPAMENGLMNGQRPESTNHHGDPRALSLRGQLILLGAALLTGTTVVGWMALNAVGSTAIWRS